MYISMLLNKMGYEKIESAKNGVEALEFLKISMPDVILLDIYGILETNPDVTLHDTPGTTLSYTLRGRQSGSISIDKAYGWPVQGRIDHIIDGVALIRGVVDGQEHTAQWPLHIKETVDIERL